MIHPLDGVLVIDKPLGPTSHDVVARARRALREKRIGHTGTLDPMATGVLPLVIGRATRLATYLSSSEKVYEAGVRLGSATDTYDAAARLAAGGAPPPAPAIDREQVEAALTGFRGTFQQMPPPYSAKKVGGVPAYKLARRNEPTALSAVEVAVRELNLLGLEDGLVQLEIISTAGFYVRSLAHDLGTVLGCGAHLESLRRTRAGVFGLDRAVPLDDLDRDNESAVTHLIPLSELLPDMPVIRLNSRGAERTAHGNYVSPQDFAPMGSGPISTAAGAISGGGSGSGGLRSGHRVRLMNEAGMLLALAEVGPDGLVRPSVVLV
ncbi:MAG: tRNA pseudouridine(55) synthase TruB [Acidobacteriota bacterium]|nr:tRNA pseudouridine(55) synthase TruB [Acidobacteriota bacterium]